MRGGGEGSLFGGSETLEKYFWMPFLDCCSSTSLIASSSSSLGAGDRDDSEERSDESSPGAIVGDLARFVVLGVVLWVGRGRSEVRWRTKGRRATTDAPMHLFLVAALWPC